MKLYLIPIASVLLQFLAAFLALRLIWITERVASWMIIAGAIFLMAIRRCISLYQWLFDTVSPPPLDITFEIFGLCISALMAVGLLLISPLFHSIRRSLDLLRQQHRLILDSAGEGIFGLDLEGKVTFVNPAAASLSGYRIEELLGQNIHNMIHYAKADGSLHQVEACPIHATLKDGEIHRVAQDVFWTKDGMSFSVEYTATPTIEKNRIIGTTVVFKDITERKKIDEELRQSEEHYRGLITNGMDLIAVLQTDGFMQYLSPSVERMLGYKPEELIGINAFDLIHSEDVEKIRKLFEEVVQVAESVRVGEYRIRRKDGSWRFHESIGKNLLSHATISGIVVNSRDITDRKQAEKELSESESRYRQLVELSPDTIYIQTEGKIAYINPAGVKLFGASRPEELLGLAALDLMHSDFKEIVAERIRHLRDAKTPVPPLEEKYLRLDGSVVDVEVAATPIVYQGKPGALVMARDVTERKRSMQEIESLAKFPGENLNPVLRIARDGTILYANPSSSPLLKLWGCEVGQLLPDDLRQLISESLTVNLRKELEVECGGSTYSLVLTPIVDLGYLNIYAANISERKRAEEALKESEKKYRLLVNQIPAVVFQGYGDWSVDFFDNKIEILSGYTKEEFDSRKIKWRDLILPEDLGEAHQIFIEALKTNKSYMREYRIRRKDGASRWIQAIGQIFCDATGKVDYVSGVFFDITEYKQAEKELRKAEERYRSIFENAIEGIFQSTPEGIYISSNTAMAKMFGYESPKELMANITDIKHQVYVDPQRRVEFMRLLEKDGFVKDFEYQVFRKDGSTFWISENARSVKTEKGETHCYEGFMQDITERKRAVEELMRFSKLESLGILAGGIAHDFNNILTAILGNIGLAMLDGKIEDRVQERLAQAEQACLRAQSLAHQLLTFAKGGAPIIKIISIAKLLKESTILALSGSKSRYEFSFPDRLWSVEADEGQIDQVISNLVINADQAMPEGGVIKIRAENFLVGEGSDIPLAMGKYVKLTFADQGIGIPPKYLDKIFDPYFSTKQKGSGLGLATAHSIIQNHSGYIKAESQVGEGTTFHIHLPAVETDPLAEEPERAEWTVGQGRILVMDDEEMVREVLGRLLEHLGYEVDSASDGSQAIEKFVKAKEAGQPFAAVFLDLTVPGGMGGKETMEQLLKIDPQVKAIVSSGYSDDPIMADFQKYGFCKVIAKPYRVVELSKILQKIMSKVN